MPYQTVKKRDDNYVHSFRHSIGIGWPDRWTEQVRQYLALHALHAYAQQKSVNIWQSYVQE